MNRLLDWAGRLAAPLGLPIAMLLFAQWPLRDLVRAGATEANDLAQWLFALYVSVAVVHAQRRGGHLVARPDLAAKASRRRRIGAALCPLPWAVFLLVVATPMAWRSVAGLERFSETLNPGYFMIKLALLLLALLMVMQSLADLRSALRHPSR